MSSVPDARRMVGWVEPQAKPKVATPRKKSGFAAPDPTYEIRMWTPFPPAHGSCM